MKCEACGKPTAVLDSRIAAGAVRRRRECTECGHRFTTFEIPNEVMVNALKTKQNLEEVKDKINAAVNAAVNSAVNQLGFAPTIRSEKLAELLKLSWGTNETPQS